MIRGRLDIWCVLLISVKNPKQRFLRNRGSSRQTPLFLTTLNLHSFKFQAAYHLDHSNPPPLSFFSDKCTSMHQLKQVQAQMIISSKIHDNFAASRLISFCALSNHGDFDYAAKIFNNLEDPNVFTWNTLIRALANGPNPQEAVNLYVKMRRISCVFPNQHTLSFLVTAVFQYGGRKCCEEVHCHVLKFGLNFDLYIVNGLVRGYMGLGCNEIARKVFDEFPERDLNLWTTLICGYRQNCSSAEALAMFNRMVEDGIELNVKTLAALLSACAKSGRLELGDRIHSFIEEKGFEIGAILGTALVHMYAKNGLISEAWFLFNNMKDKNTATWNAMICGLGSHGHGKEAIDLFRRVAKPNDRTLVGVLSACCHSGLIDIGEEIFNSMKPIYGIEPKIQHYGCMVDLLGRGGKIVEAEEMIKGMRWEADVVMLGALLGASQKHGNIEVAERVVKKMLLLEPYNHGVYVVLSNMYAEAGRWEDAMRTRKLMQRRNIPKVGGWSHVDD